MKHPKYKWMVEARGPDIPPEIKMYGTKRAGLLEFVCRAKKLALCLQAALALRGFKSEIKRRHE